jgi:hypothetical protein
MLVALCGAVWGQTPAGDNAAAEQPGPPAVIEGFRQARFGMNEEQVRQAIRKDFPEQAGSWRALSTQPKKPSFCRCRRRDDRRHREFTARLLLDRKFQA